MQDGIMKGTGNSRYLKSVADFLTQYPTYQEFAAALAAGTLPVDFNGINETGWEQLGTVLNKANLLSDETAEMYGFSEAAVPDDLFKVLVQMDGNNWYAIKVQLPDGTPVPGCRINGLTPAAGSGNVITDEKGYAFGKAEGDSPTLTAVSPYFDYNNAAASVAQTAAITSYTFTLTEKQISYPYVFTSSRTVKFSKNFGACDICVIGGGGSGAYASRGNILLATGGSGGHIKNFSAVDLSGKEVQVTIGSGGAALTFERNPTGDGSSGNAGGSSSFAISDGETYTADGGIGGGYASVMASSFPNSSRSIGPVLGGSNTGTASARWNISDSPYSGSHTVTDGEDGHYAFDDPTQEKYGGGGVVYVYNQYEGSGFNGGSKGGGSAGGFSATKNGANGARYGAAGGPGNYRAVVDGGSPYEGTTGAGAQGAVIIRKAVM